eukprot:COSAG05_NODE_2269_length_3305_cov_2.365876_2_plen_88_part_00
MNVRNKTCGPYLDPLCILSFLYLVLFGRAMSYFDALAARESEHNGRKERDRAAHPQGNLGQDFDINDIVKHFKANSLPPIDIGQRLL